QFVALDQINSMLAVAPNPGVFSQVETWLAKFDVPIKVTAGSTGNHVYNLKYQRAEVLGSVVGQMYGIPVVNAFGGAGGLYGGTSGASSYPANGGIGGAGFSGGLGGSAYGGGQYGGAYNNQNQYAGGGQ